MIMSISDSFTTTHTRHTPHATLHTPHHTMKTRLAVSMASQMGAVLAARRQAVVPFHSFCRLGACSLSFSLSRFTIPQDSSFSYPCSIKDDSADKGDDSGLSLSTPPPPLHSFSWLNFIARFFSFFVLGDWSDSD